jgi:hypothetical protein
MRKTSHDISSILPAGDDVTHQLSRRNTKTLAAIFRVDARPAADRGKSGLGGHMADRGNLLLSIRSGDPITTG